MEQSRDRFHLVRAVLHRNRRHPEQMTDIRNLSLLAQLSAMDARRVDERFFKFRRKLHEESRYHIRFAE